MSDPDRVDPLNLDFMDCPECGVIATIGTPELFDSTEGKVLMWRTSCLDGHHRDNYWYHVESGTEFGPEAEETA